MFTFFNQYKTKTGALLFALQLLIVFAVPVEVVYAQGAHRPGNTVCHASLVGRGCYPTMAACTAAAGVWTCRDSISTQSGGEGVSTGIDRLTKKGGEIALKGTLAIVGTVLEFIAKFVAKFAGMFMRSMGHILDMAIDRTINGETYRDLAAVLVGWTAVRDFSNMLFIFVLLYIAIQTILGLGGGGAKRLLSHVVIAALLINFSLFFTQVVIDAGNVLAMGFWTQMTTKQGAREWPSASAAFLEGFRMQTIFDTNGDIMTETPGGPTNTDPMDRAMIYAGGAVMMFVAGYVFLAGAVIMIVRTVWLLILMIGSPFAFVSFALPSKGGFTSWWWSNLVSQAFVAPAFVFMLFICSIIIKSLDLNMLTGAVNAKFAPAILGGVNNYAIFYNFFVIIILLLASLTVANKVSSGAGKMGGDMAKKFIGNGAAYGFTGMAAVGRQTYGRSAAASLRDKDGKETEWAKKQRQLVTAGGMKDATFLDKSKARLANSRLSLAEKGASGTYDIRNAPMGGLGVTAALGKAGVSTGAGSKKSYETHGQALGSVTGGYRGTANEKDLIATAKARFPDDPAAQKAYLEGRGVSLSADRNKDLTKDLDRKIKTGDKKEILKTEPDTHNAQKKKLAELRASNANATEIAEAEKSLASTAKTIADALKELNAKEVAELSPTILNKKVVQENLNAQQLGAILAHDKEKGYDDPTLLPAIGAAVLASQNNGAKNYMRKVAASQPGAFGLDFKKDVVDIKNEYESRKSANKLGEIHTESGKTYEEHLREQSAKSLGYMDPKEISDWDEETITHELVAKSLNKQHLTNLVAKQKIEASFDDEFFTKLANEISAGGNDAAKKYINTAKGDNPFSGKGVQAPPPTPPSTIIIPPGSRTA